MQYVGGKSRIAKEIASVIRPELAAMIWEPFCGGLSMSCALAKAGARYLICSDICAPLIALYQALAGGWVAPDWITEQEYKSARELEDTNPLKAFAGFGYSFGGKWFGGYGLRQSKKGSRPWASCGNPKRVLARKMFPIRGEFRCVSFFDVPVFPSGGLTIYADPPYLGTQSYGATGPFDHDRFWCRCQEWSRAGASVFVSEYQSPPFARRVWSKTQTIGLAKGSKDARTEHLFQVLP